MRAVEVNFGDFRVNLAKNIRKCVCVCEGGESPVFKNVNASIIGQQLHILL
jgi:hypothetical protein